MSAHRHICQELRLMEAKSLAKLSEICWLSSLDTLMPTASFHFS